MRVLNRDLGLLVIPRHIGSRRRVVPHGPVTGQEIEQRGDAVGRLGIVPVLFDVPPGGQGVEMSALWAYRVSYRGSVHVVTLEITEGRLR